MPGVDLAIGFIPCRWIAGDYVDAIPLPDGTVLLAVADVCGKGLPAALIASSVHTAVHTLVHHVASQMSPASPPPLLSAAPASPAPPRDDCGSLDLRRLMTSLNAHLCRTLPEDSFVSMVVALLDPSSGRLECVNAGHPPPLLAGPGGLVALQSGANLVLGLMPPEWGPEQIEHQVTTMEAGQVLLLYTDGLTELCDDSGAMLGTDGLTQTLGKIALRATPTGPTPTPPAWRWR